ncbi:MAG: DUF2225 domain-containing protein [Lachnospiraceae bacterium]|nr:DUF2225 domain-containing protein [Lachnospiraceae bacterium]
MNLLAGLEKFGIKSEGELDITKEEKKKKAKAAPAKKAAPKPRTESDYLLEKEHTCPVCDAKFKTLLVKTGRAKRIGQEFDLRPRHEGIDTVKYDVIACPECGYAAMTKTFEPLSNTQIKWIREQVGANFQPDNKEDRTTYTYEEAIDRYKLALVSAMVKRVKLSEKAFICLKISWLRRAQYKEMPEVSKEDLAAKSAVREEMLGFYKQAYEGFTQAMSKETPPFYGMDSNTLEFMIANMAIYFKDYDTALKLVSRLITSPNTAPRVKDKCLHLKEQIVAAKKKQDAAAKKAGETPTT